MTPTPEPAPQYPGGEDAPAYRLAFQAWTVIFLLVICTSLLHYLGSWIQAANR
ncbi:hypothetical protein [Limnoglobus roseus]|uniref:Uncharacterized protein n=1 Tax=Limnoglobus roseus TaxID=2598579 RepID=A0A5C1AFU9_9BACT|nr:hypothetical protein [Limnoglobus roseus]QEL17093.1 hypothetical protein PX52LOC_04070 [Limnoglobus roseus]